jgi:NADH-quinone oxidoreductase subunit N
MIILAYGDINTRNASFFFLLTYVLMLTSLFAVVVHRLGDFDYLTDISKNKSKLDFSVSFSLVIIFLSMAGLPCTLGFLSKSNFFFSMIHLGTYSSSVYFILLILLLNSTSSFYYYTYIIKLILTATDFSSVTKYKHSNNYKTSLRTKINSTFNLHLASDETNEKFDVFVDSLLERVDEPTSTFKDSY